jgi:uncharacterized protein (DUF1778 family)
MSKVRALRLTDAEEALINEAAELEEQPGDRGGIAVWTRRFALREAKRVVTERKGRRSDERSGGDA